MPWSSHNFFLKKLYKDFRNELGKRYVQSYNFSRHIFAFTNQLLEIMPHFLFFMCISPRICPLRTPKIYF
uniref:Putative ovule protein n=1 Tax=Solanum chacoense TaxID=4108 RepID=A0A0V0HRM8_SOLCH